MRTKNKSHFFSNSIFDLKLENFETSNLQLNIDNSSVVNNYANVNYDIDYGNGNSELNISPGTIYDNTYTDEGPYIITITATDNITGCVRVYEKDFFYGTNPAVSLGIPGNTQNQCSPKIYGFEATFSNNSGIRMYYDSESYFSGHVINGYIYCPVKDFPNFLFSKNRKKNHWHLETFNNYFLFGIGGGPSGTIAL